MLHRFASCFACSCANLKIALYLFNVAGTARELTKVPKFPLCPVLLRGRCLQLTNNQQGCSLLWPRTKLLRFQRPGLAPKDGQTGGSATWLQFPMLRCTRFIGFGQGKIQDDGACAGCCLPSKLKRP